MRPSVWRLVPAAAVAFIVFTAMNHVQAKPESKAIAWMSDFKKGQAAAQKQNKVMMVDYYADW